MATLTRKRELAPKQRQSANIIGCLKLLFVMPGSTACWTGEPQASCPSTWSWPPLPHHTRDLAALPRLPNACLLRCGHPYRTQASHPGVLLHMHA